MQVGSGHWERVEVICWCGGGRVHPYGVKVQKEEKHQMIRCCHYWNQELMDMLGATAEF